jgi:hypothetical protein
MRDQPTDHGGSNTGMTPPEFLLASSRYLQTICVNLGTGAQFCAARNLLKLH